MLTYYTNLFVSECAGATGLCHNAAVELFTTMLVQLFHAAEQGFARFQYFDLRVVNVAARYLSHFNMALSIASIITVLLYS